MTDRVFLTAGDDGKGFYRVEFLERKTNKILLRTFHEYNFCRKFVNKLKHSKSFALLSYPNFT